MGLLDMFSGMNPDQQQGLLAAAASLLQNSGPSLRPVSTGQLFGGALGAFQEGTTAAQKRKLEQMLAQQQTQLNGFKIKDAESDLANQEQARQRAEQLRQFYMKAGAAAQPGAIQTPTAVGNSLAPTVQNAGIMDQLQGQPGAAPGGDQKQGIYQQRLGLAQQLRNAGFSQEADAQETAALKFQPKVKEWQKVQQNGRVLYAPYFEDGTSGAPVPLDVAEKLHFQSIGGQTLGLNSFTGQQVSSFTNTQSPDNAASVGATIRGQNMTDARARDTLAQGKAPPGYRALADGSLMAIPGGPADPKASKEGIQRVQDAKDVLSILDMVEPLLPKATGSYLGASVDELARGIGKTTQGAAAASELKVLQGALVSKMPKMSGPQSDKDVQLYREMAGQIGDSTLPVEQRQAAARTVRALNEKYAAGQGNAGAAGGKTSGWGIQKVGD